MRRLPHYIPHYIPHFSQTPFDDIDVCTTNFPENIGLYCASRNFKTRHLDLLINRFRVHVPAGAPSKTPSRGVFFDFSCGSEIIVHPSFTPHSSRLRRAVRAGRPDRIRTPRPCPGTRPATMHRVASGVEVRRAVDGSGGRSPIQRRRRRYLGG